jgi:hypothetical protein
VCLVVCSGVMFVGSQKIGSSYPATVTLPDQLAGLAKLDDPDLNSGIGDVVAALKTGSGVKHAVGGVYAKDGDATHPVMIFAADGFLLRPARELTTGMAELNTDGFTFDEPMAVSAGPRGGSALCSMGTVQADEQTKLDLVLCGWADYGSLGLVCFINSKEAVAAADALLAIRAAVETH